MGTSTRKYVYYIEYIYPFTRASISTQTLSNDGRMLKIQGTILNFEWNVNDLSGVNDFGLNDFLVGTPNHVDTSYSRPRKSYIDVDDAENNLKRHHWIKETNKHWTYP